MISRYEPGANISILNTYYLYPKKNEKTGKWSKDSITIIYKDNDTNEKYMECIEEPEYRFYMLKDGVPSDNNYIFIDRDKVDEIVVPYHDLMRKQAELTDNLDFYYENIRNGNRKANNKILKDPRLLNSDMNIEDKYRFEFNKLYKNEPSNNIAVSFFDIEVDGINQMGDFPEPGECPINAIAYIDTVNKRIIQYLLRNPENPLIEEYENDVKNGNILQELKEFVREQIGGWKNEIRYKLDKYTYHIEFYDDELQLIYDFFKEVNTNKPEFLLAWNMRFDIPYIIARLEKLHVNPEDIICHPDFKKNKICRYYIDNQKGKDGKAKEIGKRGDKATIASYTTYLDQMIQFASRRTGQSAFSNMKLDYIGEVIANVRKLDYSHITTNIAKLPYLNYKVFSFYNIVDTVVQYVIEFKCNDINYVYNKAMMTNTRYDKCQRQITYLPNIWNDLLYNKKNCIMANNPNSDNKKPTEKYAGAYVADPTHLNDYCKRKINGRTVDICDNVIDFDYSAQYPNEIRENNMSAWTQIGKIEIEDGILLNENPFNRAHYTRGGQFIEDLDTHNWLEFCTRWLHLADYETLYDEVIKYVMEIEPSFKFVNQYTENNLLVPIRRINKEDYKKKVIRKLDNGMINPIIRMYPLDDKYVELANTIDIDEVIYRDEVRAIK